jgi:hypothetical protein
MNGTSVVDRATCYEVLRLAGHAVPTDPRRLAVCPLHNDGTASFRVFPKGWRCFGCDRRGGILDLVVALGFAHGRGEAAQWLEERLP